MTELGPLQKLAVGSPLEGISELELALYITRYMTINKARDLVIQAKEFEGGQRKRKA